MKTKIFSLLLALVFVLSACGSGSEFQQNQDKWQAQLFLPICFRRSDL